jgi:hypothetical protein
MQTVLLQINNEKGYQLLKDLEALNIVKVLKKNVALEKKSLSDQFAGSLKLSNEEYNKFQNHLTEIRSEWDRNI